MVNPFEIDVNEPIDMLPSIAYVLPQSTIIPLNSMGFADYRWTKWDGKVKHCERKTWGEILANPDKVEEQLQRHLEKNPDLELVFMLEGMATQGTIGSTVLQQTKSGMWVPGHKYGTRLKRIYSILYGFSKYCEVIQTATHQESAAMLVAMYEHDQKEEHSLLQRHIKQNTFTTNPLITTLMGASPGLGDKRATSLIRAFNTPWNIWSAGWHGEPMLGNINDLTTVDGIGPAIVNNIMRSIGRPDV